MINSSVGKGCILAACMLLLGACDRGGAQASTSAGSTHASYEVVTQTRPESVAGYASLNYLLAYGECKFAREAMNLPAPKAAVQLPKDFIIERNTWLSNGKAFLSRREEFFVDIANMAPENGCPTRLGSISTTELVKDGVVQIVRLDVDGKREIDPPMPAGPPEEHDVVAEYPIRKTFNGIAMRCEAAAAHSLLQDACVADLPDGTLTDGLGKPIMIHARDTLLQRGEQVLLTEPVRVQSGKAIDEQRLRLEGIK